jgi:sortase B
LREQFGVSSTVTDSESEPEPADMVEAEGIDFDALRAINPNVVGWIVIPGTQISYPVVQGTDNAWYLRHTFSGERNASGAIFLDYRNRADFSDSQIILHGHNMRDGSMFAPLHGWTGDRFIIHTPDDVLEFEVFNRQTVGATHEIYQLPDTVDGARTVTLSTCINGSPALRYVVQGQ